MEKTLNAHPTGCKLYTDKKKKLQNALRKNVNLQMALLAYFLDLKLKYHSPQDLVCKAGHAMRKFSVDQGHGNKDMS